MAHTCPECGSACYCGGDIDDCLVDDRDAENSCTCCPFGGYDDEDLDELDDDDIDDGKDGQ